MTMVSIGTLAQSFLQRQQGAELRAALQRLSTELTTGTTTDPARAVAGDLGPLAAIEGSMARSDAFSGPLRELGLRAGAMQDVLDRLGKMADGTAGQVLALGPEPLQARVQTAARAAAEGLADALAALNSRVGDATLFAGNEPGGPATEGVAVLLPALQALVAGLGDAPSVEAAVRAWFHDPAGYSAQVYRGASAAGQVPIAPGETAALEITADDPVLRDTLAGLALAALAEEGRTSLPPQERGQLLTRAAEHLASGGAARADLAARLGLTEARIGAAESRNAAERAALDIARAGLLSADPYATAMQLQQVQSQIEALYTLTARLSNLSLVGFLR